MSTNTESLKNEKVSNNANLEDIFLERNRDLKYLLITASQAL